MNIEKKLRELGITPTRQLEFNEINYIAKTVADKLAVNVKELSNSYNELFMRIYNCNMSYANIDKKFGKVVYFYPNNTLYFDEEFELSKIDEKVIHECIHYLQNFRKFNGDEQRIGVCNFAEFKIYGLGLNEAVTQYIASKANGEKPHRKNNEKISIYTINDQYYPYLTSLVLQLIFFTGDENLIKSAIEGTEDFENDLYNTFEENTNKILNNFDAILEENNNINRDENKIIQIYLDTQKNMYTTYFDKIYSRVTTTKEVEEYTRKIDSYKEMIAKLINQPLNKDEAISYLNTMENKFNKKYIELYIKQSKPSLMVIYQNKLILFFKKIASLFGSKA